MTTKIDIGFTAVQFTRLQAITAELYDAWFPQWGGVHLADMPPTARLAFQRNRLMANAALPASSTVRSQETLRELCADRTAPFDSRSGFEQGAITMTNEMIDERNNTLDAARIAQARKELVKSMAGRDDAEAMSDAVVNLALRLSSISIQEQVLVGSKVDPVGYARYIKELTSYAEKFGYLSRYDLEVGEDMAIINSF